MLFDLRGRGRRRTIKAVYLPTQNFKAGLPISKALTVVRAGGRSS